EPRRPPRDGGVADQRRAGRLDALRLRQGLARVPRGLPPLARRHRRGRVRRGEEL
ncbi:MAG: hypothetical protein AVDCRST_MAG38-2537, partial [uncultured Solirubrobacteraceae bacterium]